MEINILFGRLKQLEMEMIPYVKRTMEDATDSRALLALHHLELANFYLGNHLKKQTQNELPNSVQLPEGTQVLGEESISQPDRP